LGKKGGWPMICSDGFLLKPPTKRKRKDPQPRFAAAADEKKKENRKSVLV